MTSYFLPVLRRVKNSLKNFVAMEGPVVTVTTGKLRGKVDKNIDNGEFYGFLGIPYAKPPLGNLRFKAPQPPEPWTGIRDATKESSECLSRHPVFKSLIGSEDCLYLNVFTRNLPSRNSSLKPVMFWIHGGGFTSGSGNSDVYGPEFLLTEDIVLVTINYRLHILGFLSLEDPSLDIPGNAGLKDIVMALKWVKENISRFSGDPNNVTIFGESAGGAAAHYLILSPLAKGLFHKAILQSGCALNGWACGRKCATEMAQILGLETTDEKKILPALQNLPADKLYEAGEKIPDLFIASKWRPHGPVVERKSKDAFLSENPLDILKSGRYNHVPIMIGYTTREGMLSEIMQKPKPFKPFTDFELAVPAILNLQPGSDISKLAAKEIKEYYFGNKTPSAENKDPFYVLEGDNFFIREILRTIRLHKETSSEPVYLYRMSVESTLNLLKNVHEITEPGVCHGDDIGYLFKSIITPPIEPGSVEDVAVRRFVKLWTNFAKYGNPNSKQKDSLINIEWQPVTKTSFNTLDIGEKLTKVENPEVKRLAFWDKLFQINPIHKL